MGMNPLSAKITGAAALSRLGPLFAGQPSPMPFPSMADHPSELLKEFHEFAGAWLPPQPLVTGKRRWGLTTAAGMTVADQAMTDAGWSAATKRGAWIFAATSRGNAAEFGAPGVGRRPVRRLAASNTLHSELAAAISVQHGIQGPCQVFSNGCASSLDAMGWAAAAITAGWTTHALVVTAEMPLTPCILQAFAKSRVLSRRKDFRAYHATSPQGLDGFVLAEGAAAVTLEQAGATTGRGLATVQAYHAGADAYHALGLPPMERSILPSLLRELAAASGPPDLVCPHATGTEECRRLEIPILEEIMASAKIACWKESLGHTLGASGLLELLHCLRQPPLGAQNIWKWASSMGGHHAAVQVFRP